MPVLTATRCPPHQRGVTLVEILVALVVLSFGLLGLAALQATGLQFNHSSLMRSQATNVAYDLADRLRANRRAALNGAYDSLSAYGDPPACGAGGGGTSVADRDIGEWLGTIGCALPAGNGRILRNGNVFTITVRWDDSRGGGAELEEFTMTTRL